MTDRPQPTPPRDDDLADPRIDALWQATASDGPSPRIDAALRAAARREIGAGPVRDVPRVAEATRPERWWWPLTAAAAIGAVAIGVLQLVSDDKPERAIVTDMPATRAAPPPAAPRAEAAREAAGPAVPTLRSLPPATERTPERRRDAPRPTDTRDAAPATPGSAPLPAPPVPSPSPVTAGAAAPTPFPQSAGALGMPTATAPAAAPSAADAVTARTMAMRPAQPREAAMPEAPSAASPAPLAKAAKIEASGAADKPAMLPVPEWIALIRRLRDEHRNDEAAKELAAFRAAYPDADRLLPPDLAHWHPSQP